MGFWVAYTHPPRLTSSQVILWGRLAVSLLTAFFFSDSTSVSSVIGKWITD